MTETPKPESPTEDTKPEETSDASPSSAAPGATDDSVPEGEAMEAKLRVEADEGEEKVGEEAVTPSEIEEAETEGAEAEESEAEQSPKAKRAPKKVVAKGEEQKPEADAEPPMAWYIVNTFSGFENSVKRNIEERAAASGQEERFEEILIPSEQTTEKRGKRTIKMTKKFFPGYIFVRMQLTKEAWHVVTSAPRVTGFLGGKNPRPVPQREIDRMLGKAEPQKVESAPQEEEAIQFNYRVGEQVRVKTGAFANFTGDIEEINEDKRKIWLSVSIFGRPTRVEVEFSEVEPAA